MSKIEVNRQLCGQCGLCSGVCPALAIVLHGWGLEVDDGRCTGCGQCVAVCPTGALMEKSDPTPNPFPAGEGEARG